MQFIPTLLKKLRNKTPVIILLLMFCSLSTAFPSRLQAANRHMPSGSFSHKSPNEYPITPFVVGPKGQAGYSTIQSAIDAAVRAGGISQAIFVQPGIYRENLDFSQTTALKAGITLVGAAALGDEGQVEIIGTHTPPSSGTLVVRNFRLSDARAIFSSQEAGNGHLVIIDAFLNVKNGYTFDLPHWKGIFELFDINPGSEIDGGINNTGGGTLFMFSAGLGSGSSKSMHLSGTVVVGEADISCPVNFGDGSSIQMDNVQFAHSVTFSGNAKGSLNTCRFNGGSTPAITMASSSDISIAGSIIESSNDLAVNGTGSGTLTLVGASFTESEKIAKTVTLGSGKFRGAGQVTRFVVGPAPDAPYQKIQDALNAAQEAGGGMIYVQPGEYRENLTFFDKTQLVSIEYEDAGHTILTGEHTPPEKGSIAVRGLRLVSPQSIFKSNASGSASISILECSFAVADGWVFDLPNWTGSFNINDCGSQLSSQDGVVNNSAGATIFTNNCQVGAGTTRPFIANGDVRLDLTFLDCPSKISEGTIFINFGLFSKTMDLSGKATGNIFLGDFFTGDFPALNITSSKPITLKQTTIDSSATNVITGTGTLKTAGVSFLNSSGISKTIITNHPKTLLREKPAQR